MARYDKSLLHGSLMSLEQSDYVNILILGETGVGKSTFINAFVNYLTFDSLDEALENQLNWVVPCCFSVPVMDRSNPDAEIQEHEVKVGSQEDEKDGSKGESATQKTAVYPITIGNQVIRLIDTPGIGDTRGLQYDKANMADILTTLGAYDDLHGVLILLKSNNSRLTVTFNFCMKELLTHLHRSAASNMVFGFTNTRTSHYTPGDTLRPLRALIQDHSDVGLSLNTHTTYCFDSESFRYLAAFKSGFPLPHVEDYRRSWIHSRSEAKRVVDHFKGLRPHSVQSTMSLNGARRLISELTKPMAEVSQLIRTNMSMCEDKRKELADTQLVGDDLKKRLEFQTIQFVAEPLPRPRTVCRKDTCVEYKDDGTNTNTQVTIYKTHCHSNCMRPNVTPDQQGHPGLVGCKAFSGDWCKKCAHFWQDHMHVTYELKEHLVSVIDSAVQTQLRANADDVSLRQAAIEDVDQRIREYQAEHEQIQQAAAKFGLFLKHNSITPYNDATLEYLDMLIKDEESKIHAAQKAGLSAAGNRKKLKAAQEDRARHEQLVDALTRNMNGHHSPSSQVLDEAGVGHLVRVLYDLKHFGLNLREIKNTITSAAQATYRESPFRVHKGLFGGGRGMPPDQDLSEGASRPKPEREPVPPPRQPYSSSIDGTRSSQAGGGGLLPLVPRGKAAAPKEEATSGSSRLWFWR